MPGSDRRAIVLLGLLVAVLAFGVWRLFALRFSAGDIFPAYSSLRADPLGTRILYESLGRAGVIAERGYRPLTLARAEELADTTVLIVGASRARYETVDAQLARDLEGAAANGARLVIAFHPEGEPRERPAAVKAPETKPPEAKPRKPQPPEAQPISLPERWGFRYAFAVLHPAGKGGTAGAPSTGADEDPSLWHSTLVFADLDPSWRVIATRRGRPVAVERGFGVGSLVLLADSYPLSNEAMVRDRRPALLSRIVGANRRVLFDEAHLGVVREPGGVVSLMTKYRLGGLALGIAVLAALALWRSASPFLPPWPEPAEREGEAPGRGSGAALVDLVRRNIPAAELPAVCLQEWARTFPERRRRYPDRFERAQAEAERSRTAKPQDAAGACRRIARILKGA